MLKNEIIFHYYTSMYNRQLVYIQIIYEKKVFKLLEDVHLLVGNHFHQQDSSMCIFLHQHLPMRLFHGRIKLHCQFQHSLIELVLNVRHHHLFQNWRNKKKKQLNIFLIFNWIKFTYAKLYPSTPMLSLS